MDNIVDYLVVLFFVISFLSSIFKKKKTVNANSENKALKPKNQTQEVVQKVRTSNPFEDFVKSFNNEFEKAKEDSSRSEVDDYYEKAMRKSVEFELPDKKIYRQVEFVEPNLAKKIVKHDESISSQSYAKSLQKNRERHESKKAKEIRNSLIQPDSIKNFIIMNEILGKPKALQR